MKNPIVIALLCGASVATPAAAQQVTGGEVELAYRSFDEGDASTTTLGGAVELGLNRNFALQLDVVTSQTSFDGAGDADFDGVTLHGIYHLNEMTSIGLYGGSDSGEGEEVTTYGAEVGVEFGQIDLEAYLGQAESDGETVDIFGFEAGYLIGNGFELTALLDSQSYDGDASLTTYALRGDYTIANGFSAFASVGTLQLDASLGGFGSISENDNFFTLGGTYVFGAERGATFGSRSFYDIFR